jgi:hypothetical protein
VADSTKEDAKDAGDIAKDEMKKNIKDKVRKGLRGLFYRNGS